MNEMTLKGKKKVGKNLQKKEMKEKLKKVCGNKCQKFYVQKYLYLCQLVTL